MTPKPLALIRVTRGKHAGAIGFYKEAHRNLPGFGWCYVSQHAPHPTPDTKVADLPKLAVLNLEQLEAL